METLTTHNKPQFKYSVSDFFLGFLHEKEEGKLKVRWFANRKASHSGDYTNVDEGYRHYSLAEIEHLLNSEQKNESRLMAEIFMSYLSDFEADSRKREPDYYTSHVLWSSDGIRLEGEEFTIFKGIDHKIEMLHQNMMETCTGLKFKEGVDIESQKFDISRLFRKYGRKSYYTMKEFDKANPDLTEYLLDCEYEKLSPFLEMASIVLPPDFAKRETAEYQKSFGSEDVWPVGLNLQLDFCPRYIERNKYADATFTPPDEFSVRYATIYPFCVFGGTHVTMPIEK